MREPLNPYTGESRLNYLCILACELLGERSLARLPALLAGFRSISSTLPPAAQSAIRNIRLSGQYPATRRELQLMIDGYRSYFRRLELRKARGEPRANAALPARFRIDDDLSIHPMWTHLVPDDVSEALHALTTPLELRAKPRPTLHDTRTAADIDYERGYAGRIEAIGITPPPPPAYDVSRTGCAPGTVKWSELLDTANAFDAIDREAGRQGANGRAWFRRLHDEHGNPTAYLMQSGEQGLEPADGIDLTGVKHLIGLPGAGKTTLLYLLAGHLARAGRSACFLFPSIEVATGFMEVLARYDVSVGLLSGQSEASRTRHVLNFATSLASESHGFAVSRASAPFFATNCALGGFATDEDTPFPHMNPPCQEIQQRPQGKTRTSKYQCALSSVCGFQHGERTLSTTDIWVGHILSTDRRVSPLFVDADLRHFDYLARTFDLLVVDECDGAQTTLDGRGTPVMRLFGDSDALWSTLIRDLHAPAAHGHNAFVAGMTIPTLLEMTGRFGRANEHLVGRIMHFHPRFRDANANTLLTSLSLISDIFPGSPDDDNAADAIAHDNARKAFELLWDAATKSVAFRLQKPLSGTHDDDDEEGGTDIERALAEAAQLTGVTLEAIGTYYGQLAQAVELWERDADDKAVSAIAAALRAPPALSSPLDDEELFSSAALLVCVSLLVLQHFGLAPHLRLMNSMGLVSDSVFESRCSRDMLAIVPESLVGRLSGVRYTVSDEGNVILSHVGFSGTPRLLPQRMIDLGRERDGGMAVLLTSATSMLKNSPSFHVTSGPDYVLRRPNAGSGWAKSRYAFYPKMDPASPGTPLRFSGAKLSQRDRILTTMVDELLKHGRLSDVEQAIRQNDVADGVGRKAAFIVNSYDQCQLLFDHIQAYHVSWRGRVRYLVRPTLHGGIHEAAVTAAEVERLGDDPQWDLLIFPMSAIGRGVNIVYRFGPRADKAMLGSLFFLTRPHPRGDSLQLIQGLVARASEEFDARSFATSDQALDALRAARREISGTVEYLLRMPLIAQALGRYAEPFVADQMIIILQTIGRAMRGDCPAYVYFVDAAWAPGSARGEADTERSSMLMMMQSILRKCLTHPDASARECYEALYQSFSVPLSRIDNLLVQSHD